MENMQPRPCPECGGRRIAVRSDNDVDAFYVEKPIPNKSKVQMEFFSVRALACTQCGLTTLYALEPAKLLS